MLGQADLKLVSSCRQLVDLVSVCSLGCPQFRTDRQVVSIQRESTGILLLEGQLAAGIGRNGELPGRRFLGNAPRGPDRPVARFVGKIERTQARAERRMQPDRVVSWIIRIRVNARGVAINPVSYGSIRVVV